MQINENIWCKGENLIQMKIFGAKSEYLMQMKIFGGYVNI